VTLLLIEDDLPEEEQLARQANPTVKCGWCGAIIRLDGDELALAMCQPCYEGMMAEFLRLQQEKQAPSRASDR
jgi:hypothetical protein